MSMAGAVREERLQEMHAAVLEIEDALAQTVECEKARLADLAVELEEEVVDPVAVSMGLALTRQTVLAGCLEPEGCPVFREGWNA